VICISGTCAFGTIKIPWTSFAQLPYLSYLCRIYGTYLAHMPASRVDPRSLKSKKMCQHLTRRRSTSRSPSGPGLYVTSREYSRPCGKPSHENVGSAHPADAPVSETNASSEPFSYVRTLDAGRPYSQTRGFAFSSGLEETAFKFGLIAQSFYSRGRAPRSGFSDWPAQRKTTKKKVGR
jgi:hypothetical protein